MKRNLSEQKVTRLIYAKTHRLYKDIKSGDRDTHLVGTGTSVRPPRVVA